jgi:hypothetical protein
MKQQTFNEPLQNDSPFVSEECGDSLWDAVLQQQS